MSPSVTEKQKIITDKKILDAAQSLFSKKGFKETSMDEIVKKSGLSKGAIYGHFRNKEQLILAIHKRQTELVLNQLNLTFSENLSTIEKLRRVGELIFTNTYCCPKEFQRSNIEFFIEASRKKPLAQGFNKRYKTIEGFIKKILQEGVLKGEFRKSLDSATLSALLFVTIDGLTLHWSTMGVDFNWNHIKKVLLNTVLDGIVEVKNDVV
ncbi:MAG: hypothetical protein QG670_783 [Thermoproteota archaeon]|nr:hypothetical protein [Thermoproteota archaeon]